jgi:iron(III) transport system permease protein
MSAVLHLPMVKQDNHWIDRLALVLIGVVAIFLVYFVALPLGAILIQALQSDQGEFVWFANFVGYAQTPALLGSLWNSLWVSSMVTLIVVPLAFTFAYALTRSCMPYKSLFRGITLVPLLAPSLLSAISLIYWFGNQGVLKAWMQYIGIDEIYGAPGVVLAECLATFPHTLMILVTALSMSDARLFEAADAMGTTAIRKFFTITLPGAKYGLISAAMVTFTLVITDFGIPKVIGGNFNVLATDVFKLVIGQQDFAKGAVVAILLLTPAVLSFSVDSYVSRRQTAMLTARAIAYHPKPAPVFDRLMTLFCASVALAVLAMLAMAVFASFATFWPYNLTPSLRHYTLGLLDAEVGIAFFNSLKMAGGTALFGTALVFIGAYLLEKTKGMESLRSLVRLLAVVPMAVPGLVLGLGYIFFFNATTNPLNGLYHTLTLLTLCTIVHFYTTGHLTAVTALKALDSEFEAVSASLKVPFYKTFWRVTLPLCMPALVDMARYFFINAMTTISAVVFLYSPETKVASIAILNLDEAGEMGAAAAMAVLIGLASTVATLFFMVLAWWINRRTQAWRI